MPGKRSDPTKLRRDREEIARQMEGNARRERVERSRAKAQEDAKAFKATGEGTMLEALVHKVEERRNRRQLRSMGYSDSEPSYEGAYEMTEPQEEQRKGATVTGFKTFRKRGA